MANKIERRNGQKVVIEKMPDGGVMPVGKTYVGEAGTLGVPVSKTDPLPVTGPLTQAQLAATPLQVSLPAVQPVSDASTEAQLQALNSLAPSVYDYIALGYTGSDLTSVVFKHGGAGGTVVSTLTLAYAGGNLVSVSKS